MAEKILLIRMTGLGDVLSIGVPAIRYLKVQFPQAQISVLTFAQGQDIVQLAEPEVECITLADDQWPNDLLAAMEAFLGLAEHILPCGFDQIINLDTAFMPCLLARFLKDAGEPVSGNFINQSVQQLLEAFQQQSLQPEYVQSEQTYMASSFFTMSAWYGRWWESITVPDFGYPEYYLKNCCAFTPLDFDMRLPLSKGQTSASYKRIGLCLQQAEDGYVYPYEQPLAQALRQAGFEVWQQSGQESIQALAQAICDCDLLLTKSATCRWVALAVQTPVLLISGAIEPKTLMPDFATEPCEPKASSFEQGIHIDSVDDLLDGVLSIFEEQP